MTATSADVPLALSEGLATARDLLQRQDFAAALAALEPLYSAYPKNRDVLYMYAAALRYTNQLEMALRVIESLIGLFPRYGRGFQEKGHCLRAMGKTQDAAAAYQAAVEFDPALASSWRQLALFHKDAHRHAAANEAAKAFADLSRLPEEIVAAQSLVNEESFERAESALRAYLLQHGDHPEAMCLLAMVGVHYGVLYDAEVLLEGALKLAPNDRRIKLQYGLVLARRAKHEAALRVSEALLATDPDRVGNLLLHAMVLDGIGRFEEAIEVYQKILGLAHAPDGARTHEVHLSIGNALKSIGRRAEAVAAYRQALEIAPGFGEAWWSLANLKNHQFSDHDIHVMKSFEQGAGTSEDDRIGLCFALGKALEDAGQYQDSFGYYSRGNHLKKRVAGYQHESFEFIFDRQKAICTRELFEARRGLGNPSREPIFVVGLPRAGSTLIEQILSCHSQVEATNELANVNRITQALSGFDSRRSADDVPRYPGILPHLTAEQLRKLGDTYLEEAQIYRAGKAYFIDKNPNNYRHIGLIHLILPNAKIIDARRNAMDCCFSNFKQLFANGQVFTYGLEDIGRHYVAYVDLMNHWDSVLPGRILRVQHEQLVEDPEAEIRRMLEFLELPFEAACLRSHESRRSVRTPSSEQVRQPISKRGFHQWKPYEQWLGPLKSALGCP